MGQKTHPFGFRVGVTEAHKSRWYAPKALFAELLVEDYRIRKYVDKRLNRTPPFAAVSDVHIERTREELTVIVKTARPGLVIGPKGAEIEKLTNDLQTLTCTLRPVRVCRSLVSFSISAPLGPIPRPGRAVLTITVHSSRVRSICTSRTAANGGVRLRGGSTAGRIRGSST
jgi:hypothetical protein